MTFDDSLKILKLTVYFVLFCLLGVYLDVQYPRYLFKWQTNENSSQLQEKTESMDTVHIALSVTGDQAFSRGKTMLKSMLYFANRFKFNLDECSQFVKPTSSKMCPFSTEPLKTFPIHVHFVSNDKTRILVNSTLSNWKIDKFTWSIYRNEPYVRKIKWVPNGHAAGLYALLKLILPDILPKDIKRVIFLDTDVLFNYNIWDLWKHFLNFNKEQALGLVWEHDRNRKVCLSKRPTTIRFIGVNSGVMLLHLERLRERNWELLWHNEVFFNLGRMEALNLGEQTVYNSAIWHNPTIYYRIPCEWNFQLYPKASLYCCPVVWPLRRPDEEDCISKSESPGLLGEPNLVKLVHYNYGPKPQEKDLRPLIKSMDKTTLPKLTHESMSRKFIQVYYTFADIPHNCFR